MSGAAGRQLVAAPVRPYWAALRRRWWLVAQAVVVVAVAAALFEVRQPTRYEASAEVLVTEAALATGPSREDLLDAEVELVQSDQVLARAEATASSALEPVTAWHDGVVVTVLARSEDAGAASLTADAVAQAYLVVRSEQEQQGTDAALADLVDEQQRIEADLDALTGRESLDPTIQLRRAALRTQLEENLDAQRSLRATGDGSVGQVVAATSDLVVESAEPVQAAGIGAVAGLALGLLVVALQVRTDDVLRTPAAVGALGATVAATLSARALAQAQAGEGATATAEAQMVLLVLDHEAGEGVDSLLVTAPEVGPESAQVAGALEAASTERAQSPVEIWRVVPAGAAGALDLASDVGAVVLVIVLGVSTARATRQALRGLEAVQARPTVVLVV